MYCGAIPLRKRRENRPAKLDRLLCIGVQTGDTHGSLLIRSQGQPLSPKG